MNYRGPKRNFNRYLFNFFVVLVVGEGGGGGKQSEMRCGEK